MRKIILIGLFILLVSFIVSQRRIIIEFNPVSKIGTYTEGFKGAIYCIENNNLEFCKQLTKE